jgi:glycolate oxidase
MSDIVEAITDVVGATAVTVGEAIHDDYTHDEALTATAQRPLAVVRPATTAEVARVVHLAADAGVAITARGSGTGLSGACIPVEGGIVVAFDRMNDILEIDLDNHVAVVQPGATLDQLDRATRPHGFVYPVFPGESSASLGGNVATNAGGMRAVKYGVTRHQVLGLEAVLGTGEVIRTGGKFVKATTGYDLTQLIVGSEGTLAIVTEAILRLYPRPAFATTLLAPFASLDEICAAVPKIVASGIGPLLVEYIDFITMDAIANNYGVEVGVDAAVKARTLAYLVVVLEDRRDDRLDENAEELATLLAGLGALDVYVLPPTAGTKLIEAREKAFWMAKAAGADDILDMVVPRASIPQYMTAVTDLAKAHGSLVVGCGHAGDGNVHLSVFQKDPAVRHDLIHEIFGAGMRLGGAISGEHGIGTEKKAYVAELEDPVKLDLMRRIKAAFDPHGILNPGTIFEPGPHLSEDTL